MTPKVNDYGEASVELEYNDKNDKLSPDVTVIIEKPSAASMKRKVCFSAQDEVRHIENKKSLSKKERKTRWMVYKDYERIREDADHEMMRLFRSPTPFRRTAIRGLELFDPESISRTRNKHRKVVNAVIRMQTKQQCEGAANPESIRDMYCYLVQDSKDDARAIAWIDREVVEDYMATTMTEIQKLQQKQNSPKSVSSKEARGRDLKQRLLKSFLKRMKKDSE